MTDADRPLGRRLLMISPSYGREDCGVGAHSARLAKALTDLGWGVTVVRDLRSGPERLTYDLVPEVPLFRGHGFGEMWRVRSLVAHSRPDVVLIEYEELLY